MKSSIIMIISLILVGFFIIWLWMDHESLARRAGEFKDQLKQWAHVDTAYDAIHDRTHFIAQAPDIPDKIFYPPPAIAGRVQSVQYEHLIKEHPLIDIDYQAINPWAIVKPSNITRNAFIDATEKQIDVTKIFIVTQLKSYLSESNMTFEFDSIFTEAHKNNVRIMQNWPAGNTDLKSLSTYQSKISDDVFADVQRLMESVSLTLTATTFGQRIQLNVVSIGVRHLTGQSTVLQFPSKNQYRLDGHQILQTPPPKGESVSAMPKSKLVYIAQQHVKNVFSSLLDKYKYLIDEMDSATFSADAPTILSVGNEMVSDYIRVDKPSAKELDDFGSNVEEAMEEALFDILINHGVDVQQYDDTLLSEHTEHIIV